MLGRILPHILRDAHGAEFRTTHTAEMGCFCLFTRQSGIMKGTRFYRIKGEIKLILPTELKARFTSGIVPHLCARKALSKIRRMGSNLVGDHTLFYIFFIR